eukprot:SAG11_NODE_542_length_8640_cov_5.667603_2_plen_199_part_00
MCGGNRGIHAEELCLESHTLEDVFKALADHMIQQIDAIAEERTSFHSLRLIYGREDEDGSRKGGFHWRLHTLRVAALHELGAEREASRRLWAEPALASAGDSPRSLSPDSGASEEAVQLNLSVQRLIDDEEHLNATMAHAMVDYSSREGFKKLGCVPYIVTYYRCRYPSTGILVLRTKFSTKFSRSTDVVSSWMASGE